MDHVKTTKRNHPLTTNVTTPVAVYDLVDEVNEDCSTMVHDATED